MSEPCRQIVIGLQPHDVHIWQGLEGRNACVRIRLANRAQHDERPLRTLTGQGRQHGQIKLVGIDRADKHQARLWDASQRLRGTGRMQGGSEMGLIGNVAVVVSAGIQAHQRRLKIRRRGEHHVHRATQLALAVSN